MNKQEIAKAANKLPYMDRTWIIRVIGEAMRTEKADAGKGRCLEYMGKMESITGEKMNIRSRKRSHFYARAIVAYQLNVDGFTCETIADMMGCTRGTVQYMKSKVLQMMDTAIGFETEKAMYKKFRESI